MESLTILTKLLCAHLCADFIFQTDKLNKGKYQKGIKGIKYQLYHSAIHATIAYLFVAHWRYWVIPLTIFLSHLIIDCFKCKQKKNTITLFLVDQFMHMATIGILWIIIFEKEIDLTLFESIISTKIWITAMAYILMLKPSSILLSMFLSKWTPASTNTQSLTNAGQWIGYIERGLILTFVLVGSLEAVGFLLASKSVFRFGELNKAKEIRTTEYVLIGTFASFTLAIITGIALSSFL